MGPRLARFPVVTLHFWCSYRYAVGPKPMDVKTIISILALAISLLSLGVSAWVAWRDRAHPKIIVRRGLGREFTNEVSFTHAIDVLAILVVNVGRRTFAPDAINPLRLVLTDGTTLPIPDTYYPMDGGMIRPIATFRRPADGRLGEHDGFLVLIPRAGWWWIRAADTQGLRAIHLVDITGKVRAKTRVPRPIAEWFNRNADGAVLNQDIRKIIGLDPDY